VSYDRKAPEPLVGGAVLGLTLAAGTVQQGQAFVMTDTMRDELYIGALAADVAGRFTRPMGKPEDIRKPDPGPGFAAGWSKRQQVAATKLSGLWRSALPLRGLPMAYGDAGRAGGACMTPDQVKAAQDAWDGYCAAMEEVSRRCSHRHAEALRMAVIYEDPSTLSRAYLVREALGHLADWWNLR
jgi:hypothetical protein